MRAAISVILFAGLIRAQTKDPAQLFRSAVDAQQRGDFALAVHEYQTLLKLRPDFIEAKINLGAALAHLRRFDEAIADYRSALALAPKNRAIQLDLALAYYKKGDMAEAARGFASLAKLDPADTRVATLLGDSYLRLGRTGDAIAVLMPMERANAGNPDLEYVLGSALIQAGQTAEGLNRIERVAKEGNSADAYMLAGATRLKRNEFEAARQDLETAARLNANLPGLYTLIGTVKDKTGDDAGAEAAFRKALLANPNNFEANLYLGAILYNRRNLAQARAYLKHALQLNPTSPMARYEMALVKQMEGHLDDAVSDLEAVARDDPKWLQAHVELAALYFKLHRAADGAKQRQIVDQLSAEQQNEGPDRSSSP